MVKIGEYIGFCAYRRSYLLRPPVNRREQEQEGGDDNKWENKKHTHTLPRLLMALATSRRATTGRNVLNTYRHAGTGFYFFTRHISA